MASMSVHLVFVFSRIYLIFCACTYVFSLTFCILECICKYVRMYLFLCLHLLCFMIGICACLHFLCMYVPCQ